MKSNSQRLNNVMGQIEGVKKMIERKDDCEKVLTQLKAIKSAIGGVMDAVIEEQLSHCMNSLKNEDKKTLLKIKKQFTS